MSFIDDISDFGNGFVMPFEYIGTKGYKLGDRLIGAGERVGGNLLKGAEGFSDFLAGLFNNNIFLYALGGVGIIILYRSTSK